MQSYRPDRLVRVLGAAVSVVYYGAWVLLVLALVGIPLARLLPARYLGASWHVEAPVTLHAPGPLLTGARREALHVDLTGVRAVLGVPIAYASTGVVALEWLAQSIMAVLALLFLYHLRRLFQRMRAGAPFAAANATDLSWLGLLLLALSVAGSVFEFWRSLALSRLVEGPGNQLGTGLNLHLSGVVVALILLVLGEIFRRGAALEEEQSLVV